MITVSDAISIFLFGGVFALVCVFAGTLLHMRWIDRKIMKPLPKAAPITQQIPAVRVKP